MNSIRLRELGQGTFRDPAPFLRRLRLLQDHLAEMPMDPQVRQLRTNRLKGWRESRVAALFCHGMGKRLGHTVYLSRGESQDCDFVASWMEGDLQQIAPVQLKEVVPTTMNAKSDVDSVIASLEKYADSADLSVVLHLNQQIRFEPARLRVPSLRLASLWVLGCTSPDGSEWGLWGNYFEDLEQTRFVYPV